MQNMANDLFLKKEMSVKWNTFQEWFNKNSPGRLTIHRIHEKFVRTESVANVERHNSGHPRIVERDLDLLP